VFLRRCGKGLQHVLLRLRQHLDVDAELCPLGHTQEGVVLLRRRPAADSLAREIFDTPADLAEMANRHVLVKTTLCDDSGHAVTIRTPTELRTSTACYVAGSSIAAHTTLLCACIRITNSSVFFMTVSEAVDPHLCVSELGECRRKWSCVLMIGMSWSFIVQPCAAFPNSTALTRLQRSFRRHRRNLHHRHVAPPNEM
jgi:hypothetical protein